MFLSDVNDNIKWLMLTLDFIVADGSEKNINAGFYSCYKTGAGA